MCYSTLLPCAIQLCAIPCAIQPCCGTTVLDQRACVLLLNTSEQNVTLKREAAI